MKIFKVYVDDSDRTEEQELNQEIFKDIMEEALSQFGEKVIKVEFLGEIND